jgi:L,D-transpeptidase ErfK/SrfK
MLFYFANGQVERSYPVAVGREDWPTQTGTFRIVVREENPTWYVPSSIQEEMRLRGLTAVREVPPGPANPLGAYWLGLDAPGFGIHGTNAPRTIYSFGTHGCIRLHPADIEALFPLTSADMLVQFVYEPVLMERFPDGRVFLEVHEDVYSIAEDTGQLANRLIQEHGLDSVDREALEEILERQEGLARLVTNRAGETG